MTISIKSPTSTTGALQLNASDVLTIESDRSVDIDSGTLHVDATNNRVGIGTSSPANGKLSLIGSAVTATEGISLKGDTLEMRMVAESATLGSAIIGTYSNHSLLMYTNSTERMRIDSSGRVMLGTTSTNSFMLNVVSPDTARAIGAYRQSTSTTNMTLAVYSDVTATNTNHFRVDADGDVRNTNNSYGALSDQTIKQQIVDANSQLEDIKAVQVRKYKLNSEVEAFGDDAPIHIGVIAQELESAGMSGLVDEDEETNLKSVKYSVLYLKALKALQEAITKIEALEARVATLEGN